MQKTTLQKFEKEISEFPAAARLIVVHDDKTLQGARDFVVAVKVIRKEINETFDPIITKAHQTHKEAVAQKKKYDDPLKHAEAAVKLQIEGYMTELDRIEKEAEEKAFREEEERLRIEEEELKKAEALEREGHEEAAEKVREEIPLPTVYIPPKIPKLEGMKVRKIPKWRVENIKLVPRKYLMIDSAQITQLVKATKGQVRIPGIVIYMVSNVAVGARE